MKEITARIVSTLDGLGFFDSAAEAHDAVETALWAAGLNIEREVWIEYRDDGRHGRYDLVAWSPSDTAAIEIDRKTPRKKSLAKLRAFSGARVVVLREVPKEDSDIPAPEGIDAVVALAWT